MPVHVNKHCDVISMEGVEPDPMTATAIGMMAWLTAMS